MSRDLKLRRVCFAVSCFSHLTPSPLRHGESSISTTWRYKGELRSTVYADFACSLFDYARVMSRGLNLSAALNRSFAFLAETRDAVLARAPHPPAPSPRRGEGELRSPTRGRRCRRPLTLSPAATVPLPHGERDLACVPPQARAAMPAIISSSRTMNSQVTSMRMASFT